MPWCRVEVSELQPVLAQTKEDLVLKEALLIAAKAQLASQHIPANKVVALELHCSFYSACTHLA